MGVPGEKGGQALYHNMTPGAPLASQPSASPAGYYRNATAATAPPPPSNEDAWTQNLLLQSGYKPGTYGETEAM